MAIVPYDPFSDGSGGGSLQVFTRSDNDQPAVFATFADLETYTATPSGTADAAQINVGSAQNARFAFVVGSISNNVLTADSVYIRLSGEWTLAIADLQGLPGMDGMGTLPQDIPANTLILAADENGTIVPRASAVRQMDSEVQSSMPISSPSAGAYRLGNLDIFNDGIGISVQDFATGLDYIPVAYERSDSGSERPTREVYQGQATTPPTAASSETFSGQSHQFAVRNTGRGTAQSYTFLVPANAVAVTGCNITIRYNSHTDPRPAFDYMESTGGEGFTLTAGDGTNETDALVTLPRAAFFPDGVDIYITITAGTGQSLELRGQTLDLTGIGLGMEEVPVITVMGQTTVQKELADLDDVVSSGSSSATTTTDPTDSPVIAPAADNQQLVNQAVDSAVATLQNTIFNSGRSFIRFNDGFTIDNTNLATFEDKNIIYTAKNDKGDGSATRPDVNLPTDADIAAAGESYPVTFEFTHLGGTARSTTTNVVRLFFGGEIIGQLLRDDASVVVKEGVGQDYIVTTGNFDPNDTILPTGVFNLKTDTPISDISTISTELAGVSIVAGDAYLVETGGTWSGLTIPNNSILVATINSPSLVDSAGNNDWLLLDNPRVNAKSAAFLANFAQDGIRFNGTRNVQVDPSNVFEFTSMASGTPEARELGANTQGANRSITYADVPIQFTDLVGGRLAINLNFNVTRVTGFSPSFNTVRLEYPGGIIFNFPVNGAPTNGNFMATIDIPNVDYASALNQDCILTLFYDFFGASFFGEYTVSNVINTAVGRLHEPIVNLIASESMPLEARLQAQIDGIKGEVSDDEASFAAIQDRISPYRNNVSLSPDTNVRYLDSTGSDAFPAISAMTAVNPLNTAYTMGSTAVFIAVAVGIEQAVMNGGTQTILTSENAQTDPNLELGESSSFEGRTYFVYRLSNQAISDVIQTFDLTFVQVVAWQDDINTLDSDIDRIDAELEHAALNLSDDLIDVLDNNVEVTEESNPTILPTDYNKSFSTNDTQTVFYEASPKAPSGGQRESDVISASSAKLIAIPESHPYANGVILQADDGSTTTDLVNFVDGQLVANVFVPAIPSGSKTVTVHPLPANQVQRDWYSIPLHTPDLHAESDELFFTRDVPVAATTLNFQYRYDANGGHGATQTINLVISDINQDANVSASLALPDGESVNVGFDWQASQRRIRVTGTPFASDPNFFIFDMEVGVTYTETRTTPATPATTRPVTIGLQRATGQDAVIAAKVSAGGDLVLVGDIAEVDTNYTMTTLFGGSLGGNFIVFSELATYLNYTQFSPSAQTVVNLENHATLPQFGLFTTEYTSATVVTFDTQLHAFDSDGNPVKLGEELILLDTQSSDRYNITIANGVLTPVKIN